MAEQLAPEHFRDWNEQMIQRYDPEIFHHHPRGTVRWVERKRVAAVLRSIQAAASHEVLDVGCGAGNILDQLSGRRRVGIDLSTFMVKRARERLKAPVEVLLGDAEHLPFAASSFDRVVASSLLSHVLHPEKVVSELKRVARPGARMVISVSDEDQIERGLRWVRALRLENRLFAGPIGTAQAQVYHVDYHLHRFSLQHLREVVGNTLREVSVTKVPTRLFPVHWVVVYAC